MTPVWNRAAHQRFGARTVALQVGGGLAGAIIVEDAPGVLPDEVAAMEELLLVLLHLNMPDVATIAAAYEANCIAAGGSASECAEGAWAEDPSSGTHIDTVLVNGMTQPTLDLVANKIGKTRATLAIYDPYCEFL